MQATMLNATTISYEKSMQYLRKIAESWVNDKPDLLKTMETINDFKKLVAEG